MQVNRYHIFVISARSINLFLCIYHIIFYLVDLLIIILHPQKKTMDTAMIKRPYKDLQQKGLPAPTDSPLFFQYTIFASPRRLLLSQSILDGLAQGL